MRKVSTERNPYMPNTCPTHAKTRQVKWPPAKALHMDSRKQELLEARFQASSAVSASAGSASLPAAPDSAGSDAVRAATATASAAAAASAVTTASVPISSNRNGAFSQSSSQSSSVNLDASLSNPPPASVQQPSLQPQAALPVSSLANSNSQSLQESGAPALTSTAPGGTLSASRTPGKGPRKRRAPDGVGGGGGGGTRRIDEFYSSAKPQSTALLTLPPPPPPPPLSSALSVSQVKVSQQLPQQQPQQQQQQPSSNNNSEEDNNSNSGSRSSDGGLLGASNASGARRPPGKRKKLQQQQPLQQQQQTTVSQQPGSSATLSSKPGIAPGTEKPSPPPLQQQQQIGGSSPTPQAILIDYRNNSGSDSCSQLDAAVVLHPQLQATLDSSTQAASQQQQAAQSQQLVGQQQSEQLAALLKAREQLERQVSSQQKVIETLRENQERGREVLRALLAEKSRQERRAVRDRCRENRLRLGQFQIVRHGSDLLDKWFDGFAFEEAHRRRQEIEHGKERIEKERRLWMKRKPAAGGTTPKTSSSRSAAASAAGKYAEVDADEFFTQLEIYDIQRQALVKDEKDLRDEVEKLDRERNVHIREMKRIQNEDSSRFKGNQELHDRYMLLSLLGKGGFSEVHKAYDMTEHRFVACKIHQLSPSWPKEKKDNYIRHAVREIEIHKTLQHPRIVKVYDVFDIDSDCFCTVLEYSKGCDLDFYLKQNKSLPEREARNVICQVVSALKYLNQRRPPVIHYDLKPGNILLGEGDSVADIKLTDFGLSKVMTEDKFQADSGMDLTSQGAGTYWYLPPECFETGPEAPKISSKVDVWSVGVIFYQCLYGQKPFGNNMTQADILRNHTILKALKIDFPQSTPGNCKVSEQAKNFIRRCVTYDKHQRPDVFQLAEDEYLKSKAQLKFDTTTAAYSPAGMGGGGVSGGSGGSSVGGVSGGWGLMPPPGPM